MTSTTWRGVVLDSRSAAMMTEVAATTPTLPVITPIYGSWQGNPRSAGTHLGAGAIDIGLDGWTVAQARALETAMRRVGWAAWYRPDNWDGKGGKRHIHAIAIGATDLSTAAANQVTAYTRGLNGLANLHSDTGTRDYVRTTWETYLRAKATAMALTPAELDAIADRVLDRPVTLIDPATGVEKGTTTLRRKVMWMAREHRIVVDLLNRIARKIGA